jgi:16S rRNA (guanine527-N7)-methyltransferase
MTEEEAKQALQALVPRETLERLEQLAAMVIAENAEQNLIAPSTVPEIWARHILDSAQLVSLAADRRGLWLDIGSGGGFPGLVVGIMRAELTILVEPRKRRAAFLQEAALALGVSNRIQTISARVETISIGTPAAVISARAVAALPDIFHMACQQADERTLWLLPKGRSAAGEVAEAAQEWQGEMRLEPSLSQADSAIVVAQGVRRKRR